VQHLYKCGRPCDAVPTSLERNSNLTTNPILAVAALQGSQRLYFINVAVLHCALPPSLSTNVFALRVAR
jgi:hypothetical protein